VTLVLPSLTSTLDLTNEETRILHNVEVDGGRLISVAWVHAEDALLLLKPSGSGSGPAMPRTMCALATLREQAVKQGVPVDGQVAVTLTALPKPLWTVTVPTLPPALIDGSTCGPIVP
jgi:hypothetical protein